MIQATSKIGSTLEIEYKYLAGGIERSNFVNLCNKLKPDKKLAVRGPDVYFKNSEGRVLRWRIGPDSDWLTIKSRASETSSLVRRESELEISAIDGKRPSKKEIYRFIHDLGFKEKLFRIDKDCDIFWYESKKGEVCVVYYTVYNKDRTPRHFIEIEAEKGQDMTIEEAISLVVYWEDQLGLNPKTRRNTTLLEIYSNELTQMLKQ